MSTPASGAQNKPSVTPPGMNQSGANQSRRHQATPDQPSPSPPQTDDSALIDGLHQDLVEAGFTNDGVAELLGAEAVAALDREQVVPGQLRILQALRPSRSSRSSPSSRCGEFASENDDETDSEATQTRHKTRGSHPCAVLTALWLVAVEVTAEQVDAALPRTGVRGLQQLGLAAVRPAEEGETGVPVVVPCVDLRPYRIEGHSGRISDFWVTSDLSAHQVAGALPYDHVLGVGQASLTLAASTHRRPAAAALDIGTGCGIQLLHLLDHCEHVTGTDLSARALQFARFNLLLNAEALHLDPHRLGDRVALLQGSLLEPVAGRRFDLVVSNPPFVISPRSAEETESERYTYRDGGREGDALMAELIAGLPAVLNPGATVQMLGNWEVRDPDLEVRDSELTSSVGFAASTDSASGSGHPKSNSGPAQVPDWAARPRQWVQEAGLHAWFIQRDAQSPAEYAETWLRDASEERSIADFRRRYASYLADFETRGVERIGFGLIWLQRPQEQRADTDLRSRFEEIIGEVQQPLGPVIGESAQRAAEAERAVLEKHLVAPDSVTEERYQRFGAEHPEVIIARQGAGLRRARPISSAAAGFLAASDGEYSAAQLIVAVCSLTGTEESALQEEVLDLYVEGFLS